MAQLWQACILFNLLLSFVVLQAQVDVFCASGWTANGRVCYKAYSRRLSWENSLDTCRQDGAELATVTDHYINDFVSSLAANAFTESFWIGLNRLDRPTTANGYSAVWSDGSDWSIFQGFWADGQPKTNTGSCVFVSTSSVLPSWSISPCEKKHGFVCQYSGCYADAFRCLSGECLALSRACDEQIDCLDGSDEIDCPNSACVDYIKNTNGEINFSSISNPSEANRDCKWTIEGPIGSVIELQFIEFKNDDGYEIIVMGGAKTESSSWTLLRLSEVNGNSSFKLRSPNNFMIVRFSSNGNRRLNNFLARWRALQTSSPDTGVILEAKTFFQSLSQEFYPDFYLSNQENVYIIRAENTRDIIQLQLEELDLHEGDHIFIRDGNSTYAPLLGKFGAAPSTRKHIFSTGAVIYLLFKTRRQVMNDKKGFLFYYKTGCDIDIVSPTGEVATPGYPYLNYANFQTCKWTVSSPLRDSITLHFNDDNFGIDSSDLLQVSEIGNSQSDVLLLLTLSGFQVPQDLQIQSGEAHISFTTSALNSAQGFMAKYSIGCPDPFFNTDTIVTPRVSSFPYRIKLNIACPIGYVFSSEEFYDNSALPKSLSSVEMECLYRGSWNVENTPQCIAKYCGVPPSINQGYIVASNGTQFQSVANYACLKGYQLSGSPDVPCDETGSWEQAPICNVLRCPSLALSNIVPSFNITHKDGTASGSIVSFSCPAGYKIEGSPLLYCQDNGTWDYPVPSCSALLCIVPGIVNGMVRGNPLTVSVAESLTIECNKGYVIRGTQNPSTDVTCLPNQTFGTLPKCEVSGFNYCAFNNCSTNETCVNQVGGFNCICRDGYFLNQGFCLDIDECSDDTDGCGQLCENTEGSYQCSCKPGYSLFTVNGTNNFLLAAGETGLRQGDLFYVNHTCVLNLCPSPGDIQNGYISNPKSDYFVGDTLNIGCDFGFVPKDEIASTVCDNSSSWSPSIPSCEVAKCLPDILPSLVNGPKSIVANNPIRYGDVVTLVCNVDGKATFNKTRSCVYNPVKLVYELQGDNYECGVIDCGRPELFLPEGSAALFLTGRSTTYGGTFTFECQFPYFQTDGPASASIACQSDGLWNFGVSDCTYGVCPYPGQPSDGQAIIDGYKLGDNVSFSCDRSGFGIYPDLELTCIKKMSGESLAWNGSAPMCVDVEKPYFIGCPFNAKSVRRYEKAGLIPPIAQDNSGSVKEILVSPEFFLENQPIAADVTIMYTAFDHEGLSSTCSIKMEVIDETPPTIQCPPPVIIYLKRTENIIYFFNESLIMATDDTSISSKTLSVSSMTVDEQNVGQAFDINATVFDTAGNSAFCLFQLYVSDEKCSEYSIQTPLNSKKSCNGTNTGGTRCEFTCQDGFYFYDEYPADIFVSTCEPGQDFEPKYIPSCTETGPVSASIRVFLSYSSVTSQDLFDNCTGLIQTEVESIVSGLRAELSILCLTQQGIATVQLKDASASSSYISFINRAGVVFRIEMLPSGLDQGLYTNCSSAVESEVARVLQNEGSLKLLKNISIPLCPDVTIVFETANEVFECEDTKARNLDGRTICLKCPPGTNRSPDGLCESCPVGTYWVASPNSYILSQCTLCPPGLSTKATGSTGPEYCTASCVGNFVSMTGVPPCEECNNNTYRFNSTSCRACPDKTKALRAENPLSDNCTATCTYKKSPSVELLSERRATYSFSIDECKRTCELWELLNPGSQCVGFNYNPSDDVCIIYDRPGNQAINADFDYYDRECGNDNLEICYCAPQCPIGYYSEDGFEPNCRPCPAGFTSSPGSALCSECASNETSVPGIGTCFDAATTLCQVDTCQNGGVCHVENHNFYCECQTGYTGRQCQAVIDSCASSPCYYNGNCVNILGSEYECQCPAGTNGSRCEINIDDCQEDTCNGKGTCLDGFNSFTCLCVDGFEGDQCQIRKTSACDRLACDPAGTLSCDPINEIYAVCTCRDGYEGPSCAIDIDSCTSSSCRNGGTCIDEVNDYSCICLTGFKGDRCQTQDYTCGDITCDNSVSCEDDYRTGTPMCVCKDGYDQGFECTYNFKSGIIEGELIQENNSSLRFCQLMCNFKGSSCIGMTFQAIPELSITNSGICRFYSRIDNIVTIPPTDVIASEKLCKYHTDDTFKTSWLKTNYFIGGFNVSMDDVDVQVRDIVCKGTQPIDAECRIAGSTQQLSENVSCGTFGIACAPETNLTCSDVEVRFVCARSRVFFSETCRLKDTCGELEPCVRGTCINDESRQELYRCQCPPAYEGVHCQHEIDECLSAINGIPCQNNGTCIDQLLDFSCQCLDGFTGFQCETNIDECLTADCDGAGTQECIDSINGYECSCKSGFTGDKCSVDIDDCLSQPCYHGGKCTDKINGFECSCSSGWTDLQCNSVIDKCFGGPCQNGASCLQAFNNFHCECVSTKFGKLCENSEDICNNSNPCYKGGVCSNNGQSCLCSPGYQNDGCYLSDFVGCSDIVCENGGTCSSTAPSLAECTCPEEYTGSKCGDHVNHCDFTTCKPQAVCIDGINEVFCRCPIGKTGPFCTQDIDDDFDVCLRASSNPTGAGLYFPAPYQDTGGFTLKFWIKFSQPGSSGQILTMSYSSSGYLHDNSIPIWMLNESGLVLNGYGTIPFRYKPLNDGNWHYIIVIWEKSTGHVDLILDSVRSGQVDGYAQGAEFNGGGLEVNIGAKKDSQAQEKFDSFLGCISKVEILSKAIDFNNVGEFATLSGLEGDIVRWGEFSPHGNADTVKPSTAAGSDCRGNGVGPNCIPPRDLTAPNVLSCPDDIIVSTIYGKAQVMWTEPSFDGALSISSTHQPGAYFNLGVHIVIYTAKDEDDNTAFCDFKVFVNSDNCSSLESPRGGGTQECYNSSVVLYPFFSCTIECPNSDLTFVEDTPRIYSCGPGGRWKSLTVLGDLYPSCGKIVSAAVKSMSVNLKYSINFTDCSSITAAMNNREILDDLTKFRQIWGASVCSNSDCSDVAMNVACDNLPNTFVQFNLSNVNSVLTSGQRSSPAEDALASEIFDNGLFNVSDIFVSSNLDTKQFEIHVTLSCEGNQVLQGEQCVECGPGTFYDGGKMECINCPIGSFQDQYGQTGCQNCPDGQTTQRVGSEDASLCKDACSTGQYFSVQGDVCSPCGIGFYQDMIGQFECRPCAVGQVTGQEGSVSNDSCSDGCVSGEQLLPSGVCAPCPIGTYRELGFDGVCTLCPNAYTTPATGSINQLNCSILKCPAGSRANAENSACQPCDRGQYQPNLNQKQCLSCSENFTTENKGAVDNSSCVRYCPSGQEFDGSHCVECDIAFYKSNEDGLLGKCQPCKIGYLTPTTGSTKSSDCNIRNCTAGFKIIPFINNNEICLPCPLGEYQPEPFKSFCIKCPEQTFTRVTGSTNISECKTFCDPGYEFDVNKNCQVCAIGYYKNNNVDRFSSCELCPDDKFITDGTASVSENDCIIANCSAGSFRNDNNQCELCQVGFYQAQRWQTECISCPKDYSTSSPGSESDQDCFLNCPAGKEDINGTCIECSIGFYKYLIGIEKCTECQTDFITSQVGSIRQADCNIRACSPGNYRSASSNQCFPCPYGQYQPQLWQDLCLSCQVGYTTFVTGALTENECFVDCSEGTEYISVSSSCQQCPRGTYRDKVDPSQASCILCPKDFITQEEGSSTINDCTVRNCSTPGEFRNPQNNLCEVCGLGTYNNVRWRESCTSCPPGFTTRELGKGSLDDCFRDCPSGRTVNENTNVCEDCGRGFFREKSQSWTCQACPQGLSTPGSQAITVSECTVSTCLQGQFYNATLLQCEACPLDTYQPQANQLTCLNCPDFLLTLQTGVDSLSDCISKCFAGLHNCSQVSTCQDTANGGVQCVCNENYFGDGDNCTHVCDASEPYCKNGGVCSKTSPAPCTCQDPYTGRACQEVISENLGADDSKPVIVGVSIGGVILLLALLLLLVFVILKLRKNSSSKKSKHSGDDSSYTGSGINQPSSRIVTRANTRGHPSLFHDYSNASSDPSVYLPRKGGPEANAAQSTFIYDNNSFLTST